MTALSLKTVYLEEESADTFKQLVYWMYRGLIVDRTYNKAAGPSEFAEERRNVLPCMQLFLLADKLLVTEVARGYDR